MSRARMGLASAASKDAPEIGTNVNTEAPRRRESRLSKSQIGNEFLVIIVCACGNEATRNGFCVHDKIRQQGAGVGQAFPPIERRCLSFGGRRLVAAFTAGPTCRPGSAAFSGTTQGGTVPNLNGDKSPA